MLPSIAWQSDGRNLHVEPVDNAVIKKTASNILSMAAQWRYQSLLCNKSRETLVFQMWSVAHHVRDYVRVPVVRDAETLLKFFVAFNQSTLDGQTHDSRRVREAAVKVLRTKEKANLFAKNVKNFNKAVWKTALIYKLGTIPLEEVLIVCIDPAKGGMVNPTSQVGLAAFTLTQKRESSNEGLLSPKHRASIREMILSCGNDEICSTLLKQFSKSNDDLSFFNQNGMIRWKLGGEDMLRNLLLPGVYDPLFRLLGSIVGHYGRSEIMGGNGMLSQYEATVLYTEEEIKQQRHRDYNKAELLGRGVALGGPLPWSADIPLVTGGLYVNIWHGVDPSKGKDFAGNQNICIHVPQGYVIMWRGDLIHAGGYDNKLKNGAMRLHLYIPTTKSGVESLRGGGTQKVDRSFSEFECLSHDTTFTP